MTEQNNKYLITILKNMYPNNKSKQLEISKLELHLNKVNCYNKKLKDNLCPRQRQNINIQIKRELLIIYNLLYKINIIELYDITADYAQYINSFLYSVEYFDEQLALIEHMKAYSIIEYITQITRKKYKAEYDEIFIQTFETTINNFNQVMLVKQK